MTKSNFMRIVLVVGSALILVGVSLMGWMIATEDERSVIEVQVDDGKTHAIEFENLSLIPGEECEYIISLESENAKKYDLSLDFVEIEEKTLKNFAFVKIIANGEIVCDELLATVFENEDIILPVDFNEGKNTELKIVYYLPLEVGNEAQDSEALFELLITASNE